MKSKEIFLIMRCDLEKKINTPLITYENKTDAKIYVKNQIYKKSNLGCVFLIETIIYKFKGGQKND
jgi:hypothetical protein